MRPSSRRLLVLCSLVCLGLGCDRLSGGGEEDESEPSEAAEPEAEEAKAAEPEAAAGEDGKAAEEVAAAPPLECPDGGTAKGAAPPAGHELWCEREVDGKPVRHGRWTRWHDGTSQR